MNSSVVRYVETERSLYSMKVKGFKGFKGFKGGNYLKLRDGPFQKSRSETMNTMCLCSNVWLRLTKAL